MMGWAFLFVEGGHGDYGWGEGGFNLGEQRIHVLKVGGAKCRNKEFINIKSEYQNIWNI